jgi:hypothetical protein
MRRFALPIALALFVISALPALAHQPFFEEQDTTAAAPWRIKNPTVSTVIYATLESPADVDYFAFNGKAGQRILLEITVPQIAGQEEFAPTMALVGPGLPPVTLPADVSRPAGSGVLVLPPPPGPPSTFFEPFSRTSYWERQSQRVTLPKSGRFVVAVWHPQEQVGRYGFVIGEREVPGGDLSFGRKLRTYWTPVVAPSP